MFLNLVIIIIKKLGLYFVCISFFPTKVPVHGRLGIENTKTNLVLCYRNLKKHFLKY